MIFLSAGHNPKKRLTSSGFNESDLTVEFRGLVAYEIIKLGGSVIIDHDTERLADYISKINPGASSVLCEIHFNSGVYSATGTECIVRNMATKTEIKLADLINRHVATILQIPNRSVKTESQSRHNSLQILHTGASISILPEICFITNNEDIEKYQTKKVLLSREIAGLLVMFDRGSM